MTYIKVKICNASSSITFYSYLTTKCSLCVMHGQYGGCVEINGNKLMEVCINYNITSQRNGKVQSVIAYSLFPEGMTVHSQL